VFDPTEIEKQKKSSLVRGINSMYICEDCQLFWHEQQRASETRMAMPMRCPHRKVNLDQMFNDGKQDKILPLHAKQPSGSKDGKSFRERFFSMSKSRRKRIVEEDSPEVIARKKRESLLMEKLRISIPEMVKIHSLNENIKQLLEESKKSISIYKEFKKNCKKITYPAKRASIDQESPQ
jgi:hypothetical protein